MKMKLCEIFCIFAMLFRSGRATALNIRKPSEDI